VENIFIIGEIGQNHNGSVDIAKLIIDLVCRPIIEDTFNIPLKPIDAIKLVKRDLNEELSTSQMNKVYNSPHSFGKTYSEHRAFLELKDEEHFELYRYSKEKNIKVVETICAVGAMSILKLFTPDYIKVASRDLTNLPLIHALSETNIPVILSTGMGGKTELDEALNVISKYHSNISILHCTSEYPTQPQNVNLQTIPYLKEHYPQYKIGYSDHTIGISTPVLAAALGAEIIEKHVTIDRRMKGTDQAGSLGPDGVNRMIRDIRLLEISMGEKDIFICNDVEVAKNKLERSIACKADIEAGEIITIDKLHLLSPGDGIKWRDRELLLGKTAKVKIPGDEIIYFNMVR
jgi:3-deoxy-D-glycero-D-galacto-nononate 9-phosphate synthase